MTTRLDAIKEELERSYIWDHSGGETMNVWQALKDLKWAVARIEKLEAALRVAQESLCEITTSCTHDENDKEYRPLSDNYGWCSTCGTKVEYKRNESRIAMDAVNQALAEVEREK